MTDLLPGPDASVAAGVRSVAATRTSMDVYFSTVVRGAPLEQGGEIVRVDWSTKKVLGRAAIVPRHPAIVDPNPRGNARGGRGIVVLDDQVVVASYHTLHIFDRQLRHQRDLSHHHFAGIHELHHAGGRRVWVASTSIDSAFEIDLDSGALTNQCWPREIPTLRDAFQLPPLDVDKNADNRTRYLTFTRNGHLHLNALASWRGEVYALFNVFGAVVNLTSGQVVVRDRRIERGHNLSITGDGTIVVNDTRGHYVRLYEMETGRQKQEIDLMQYDWVRGRLAWQMRMLPIRKLLGRLGVAPLARSEPLYVRGLALLGDHLFIGASPAMILQVDRHTGRFVDGYQFSRDLDCCIHGLWTEPRGMRRPG